MIYLSEQLRALRKARELTQEDVACALHVSPQSVSKWERGESYPDIELLPALANFFETSVDTLIGMDRLRSDALRRGVFAAAHACFRERRYAEASEVLQCQLDLFPNDPSLMSELAFCLCFVPERLPEAIALCETVLRLGASAKVRHTTQAALALMYAKQGNTLKANEFAATLPHVRESREQIQALLDACTEPGQLDEPLRTLVLGE